MIKKHSCGKNQRRLMNLNLIYHTLWNGEEISACARVHKRYVMDTSDHVQFIILLPHMAAMSFLLVVLARLNVGGPKH